MDHKKQYRLLRYIEDDAHISHKALANALEEDVETVSATIAELEHLGIISGYKTMINWDATESDYVSAMIEVSVNLHKGASYEEVAEMMYRFKEVEALYLTSGAYDYMLLTKRAPMQQISRFVNKLASIDEVSGTATHIVMNRYKDHGTIFESKLKDGERLVISQ
ncbi:MULTISPECIES: Lrp/AsnC family transcriptional regulator [Aerococcus]|uniref:Lrp/AsnC family transcriptional regulator n=1 Tax=Aerococcus sanguinicola TaxID=119206 RepID=A0A5N1GK38_9LACT|nr:MULTISPECIES: Lrp/AsnC family transcriptional regulator [Aerococcus]KAA9300381.1 Lrp/AsnC family transcriptional regulator [Aerococcus sanguinicola]MDK6368968.1 Lrp/AsnC family transcriptional regulator [Aerococcus sp. UMB9870]MDK6678871.1 Lrp/AsnC family transcriptional regulator [Aerococcus sp. UMB8608]MDK6686811.1 Lrp/AsnC family transcriptional regulator [Aerococcus sp. UMB8623]MDK6939529.1 Lrp/AsnC family transcriptional regulator [Aerococcus sp. UMB8487]